MASSFKIPGSSEESKCESITIDRLEKICDEFSREGSIPLNVFVLQNPAGITNSELVIEQYEHRFAGLSLLVNLSPATLKGEVWDASITVDHQLFSGRFANKSGQLLLQIKRAWISKRLIKIVKAICKKSKGLKRIFYQNLNNIVSNSLYFDTSLGWNESYIIEDGIANYYEYFAVKPKLVLYSRLKSLFFCCLGIRFKAIKSLTGINLESTAAQFVRFPELTEFPHKSCLVKINQSNYEPNSGTVLFIGQEAGLSPNRRRDYMREVSELIRILEKSGTIESIFYKPHWDTDFKIDRSIFSRFRTTVIHDKNPVEKLISILKPQIVVSFESSALVNIALEYKKMLDLGGIQIYAYPVWGLPKQVKRLFLKSGIKLLNAE